MKRTVPLRDSSFFELLIDINLNSVILIITMYYYIRENNDHNSYSILTYILHGLIGLGHRVLMVNSLFK